MASSCHQCFFVSLVNFSYCSKFHDNINNINAGSGVRAIFVYKGLTRNSEIENNPV